MGNLEKIELPEDMTSEEKESLRNYMKNGCPGLLRIKEDDIFKWFELYMSGKTYAEIATVSNTKKDLILYISYKQGWLNKRMEHYNHIVMNMDQKLKQTKLDSINTVATIVQALGKYYNKKFDKFLQTNDEEHIKHIDTKMLSQYYKSMETLDKIVSESVGSNKENSDSQHNPAVNINLLGANNVEEDEDGNVNITNDSAAKKILHALYKKTKESKDK